MKPRLHQALVRRGEDFAPQPELFTIRRAPGKLKHLAGSEPRRGAFAYDIAPAENVPFAQGGHEDGVFQGLGALSVSLRMRLSARSPVPAAGS